MQAINPQPTASQTRNLLENTSAEIFAVGHGHSVLIRAEKADHPTITATMKAAFPSGRIQLETPIWLGDRPAAGLGCFTPAPQKPWILSA